MVQDLGLQVPVAGLQRDLAADIVAEALIRIELQCAFGFGRGLVHVLDQHGLDRQLRMGVGLVGIERHGPGQVF
jgi:hypothetical protein